jgi:hypothetical protein
MIGAPIARRLRPFSSMAGFIWAAMSPNTGGCSRNVGCPPGFICNVHGISGPLDSGPRRRRPQDGPCPAPAERGRSCPLSGGVGGPCFPQSVYPIRLLASASLFVSACVVRSPFGPRLPGSLEAGHAGRRSSDQPLSKIMGRGPKLQVGPPTRVCNSHVAHLNPHTTPNTDMGGERREDISFVFPRGMFR